MKTIDYKDRTKQLKIKLLQQIDYFDLEEIEDFPLLFEEIQYHMKEEIYGTFEEIIKSNSKSTKIYFIIEGQVEILIHNRNNECC